jgi:hypothetical protein
LPVPALRRASVSAGRAHHFGRVARGLREVPPQPARHHACVCSSHVLLQTHDAAFEWSYCRAAAARAWWRAHRPRAGDLVLLLPRVALSSLHDASPLHLEALAGSLQTRRSRGALATRPREGLVLERSGRVRHAKSQGGRLLAELSFNRLRCRSPQTPMRSRIGLSVLP